MSRRKQANENDSLVLLRQIAEVHVLREPGPQTGQLQTAAGKLGGV